MKPISPKESLEPSSDQSEGNRPLNYRLLILRQLDRLLMVATLNDKALVTGVYLLDSVVDPYQDQEYIADVTKLRAAFESVYGKRLKDATAADDISNALRDMSIKILAALMRLLHRRGLLLETASSEEIGGVEVGELPDYQG